MKQPRSRPARSAPADAPPGPVARRRFFVAEAPAGVEAALAGDLAHRLARVLRLGVGDAIELFDGSGRVWPGVIAATDTRLVRVALAPPSVGLPEPPTVLFAALVRPNRFEWLLEKATELGATAIRPLLTARTAVRADEIGRSRLDRWRRIAVEAVEQCGRVTVPALHEPATLAEALRHAAGRLVVAAEPAHGRAEPLGAIVRGVADRPVTLVIGPEGGLTAEEVRAVLDAGGCAASLGPLTLRAETAAVASLAIVADARQSSGRRASLD
jgi:16S rRNA (uracil1498-N3)-methyltransferase